MYVLFRLLKYFIKGQYYIRAWCEIFDYSPLLEKVQDISKKMPSLNYRLKSICYKKSPMKYLIVASHRSLCKNPNVLSENLDIWYQEYSPPHSTK